jgi:hypothetical protein
VGQEAIRESFQLDYPGAASTLGLQVYKLEISPVWQKRRRAYHRTKKPY